jgi:hypothetical protein
MLARGRSAFFLTPAEIHAILPVQNLSAAVAHADFHLTQDRSSSSLSAVAEKESFQATAHTAFGKL